MSEPAVWPVISMLSPEALSSRGLLYVYRHFFSPDECLNLIMQLNKSPSRAAMTYTQSNGSRVNASHRNTREILVNQSLLHQVSERVATLKPQMEAYFQRQFLLLEASQFLRYEIGDFFKPHRDNYLRADQRERQLSLVIFVNGHPNCMDAYQNVPSYQGGELVFYRPSRRPPYHPVGMPILTEPGMLIAFRPDILHEVTPVTEGYRLSIVTWFV